VDGSKKIELRLFDKKRQGISLGDTVTFLRDPDHISQVVTRVIGLLRYSTFADLIGDLPIDYFGQTDKVALMKDVHSVYSEKQEAAGGILGIKLELQDS
jgi:ASC-1-like (ASCH) protein